MGHRCRVAGKGFGAAKADRELRNLESVKKAKALFLSTFDLLKFDGEDVGVATMRFKACARVLPPQDRPSDILLYYLRGMAKASCEEFKTLVTAQIGFVSMPIAKEWVRMKGYCLLGQLDEVANPLVARYEVLKAAGSWSGAYRVEGVSRRPGGGQPSRPVHNGKAKMSREQWLDWYDKSRCSKCGRDGHPEKFCGDPGARDRTRDEWRALWRRRAAEKKNSGSPRKFSRPSPRFKSAKAKTRFEKLVNKALLETVRDEDKEFFANLAEDDDCSSVQEEELMAALAGEDEEAEDGLGDTTVDDDDDEDAHALVAQCFENLLNF